MENYMSDSCKQKLKSCRDAIKEIDIILRRSDNWIIDDDLIDEAIERLSGEGNS